MRKLYSEQELLQLQLALETRGRDSGVARFQHRHQQQVKAQREDGSMYANQLISRHLLAVTDVYQAAITPGQRKRVPVVFRLISTVAPDVVALVALSGMLAGVSRQQTVTGVAARIADALWHEVRKACLSAEAKQHLQHLQKSHDGKLTTQLKLIDYVHRAHQLAAEPAWDAVQKISLGRACMELVLQATDLFCILSEPDGGLLQRDLLQATDALQQWLSTRSAELSLLTPVYLPMVLPPRDWQSDNVMAGCYYSDVMAPVPFIKRRPVQQITLLQAAAPNDVFAAVNRIQRTRWRIRLPVLRLLQHMVECGDQLNLPASSVPPLRDSPLPAEADRTARYHWLQQCQQAQNQRSLLMIQLQQAADFAAFEQIYIPHQLDSRGRVYPVPSLNPQGNDLCRALLEFADGKPLGDDGVFWLKVQAANLFGIDKVSFSERVQWVNLHWKDLLGSALDPWQQRFWTRAEQPLQAFAVCLELLGVAMEGARYQSRMPVALDGSCSGLQHLGAAFRCEQTARAVNLSDTDQPGDIYQDVADRVTLLLQQEQRSEERVLAAQWLQFCQGRVRRHITKRPVMTYPYGSRRAGFTEQLLTDVIKPAGLQADVFGQPRLAAFYLAGLIEQAVAGTVVKAAEAMRWMQSCASALAAQGQAVVWRTPLGFPVWQEYRQQRSRRVDSIVFGRRLRSRVQQETDQLDCRKMVNAIAPNVVHSLDSTHLFLTVLNAGAAGITDFALVHDSFATHAGETTALYFFIREAFVALYQQPVFSDLASQWQQQWLQHQRPQAKHKVIPPLPSSGGYQLEQVLDARYAFA